MSDDNDQDKRQRLRSLDEFKENSEQEKIVNLCEKKKEQKRNSSKHPMMRLLTKYCFRDADYIINCVFDPCGIGIDVFFRGVKFFEEDNRIAMFPLGQYHVQLNALERAFNFLFFPAFKLDKKIESFIAKQKPKLISALEQYDKNVSTIKRFNL